MSAQHTPGPWRITPATLPNGTVGFLNIDHDECAQYKGIIASVSDAECIEGISKGERDANAALIAAAPDLLHALEMVRDADEDSKRDHGPQIPSLARAKIDAAIKKARGEA